MNCARKYNVYENDELIAKDLTKEEIRKEFNMKKSVVDNCIHHWTAEGYKYKIVYEGKMNERFAPLGRGTREEEKTFMSNLEDGIKGNKLQIQRMTNNTAIMKACKNIEDLARKIGFDEGRKDVLTNSDLISSTEELQAIINEQAKEIAKMKITINDRRRKDTR